ncbi:MAG: PilZ domain-containing protein [Desulfobulbales bacterium]|nr:PilZ domain-containing protein [Desulfobulbales bacterium]
MKERRKFQRVTFATNANITSKGTKYNGELLDISLQGALVHAPGSIPLEEGTRCELSIHLDGSDITMHFLADIIHRRGNKFGFKFISEDTDTATHLRRLLELNIGSSEAIDREIASLLSGK